MSLVRAALCLGLLATPGLTFAACHEVGRIETVTANFPVLISDGYVLHGDGARTALRELTTRVCADDRIVVMTREVKVEYSLIGADRLFAVTSANSPAQAPPAQIAGAGPCTLPACLRSNRVKSQPWLPAMRFSSKAGGVEAPLASPYIPVGRQRLPQDLRSLALTWTGPDATVTIDGQAAPTRAGFIIAAAPAADAFVITVTAKGAPAALAWSAVRTRAQPPAPPGFGAQGAPTDEDRVERDLWLLEDGPGHAEWRLFAVSDIASMRERRLAADLAWRRLVQGAYDASAPLP